jgi:N utilization substance protein A
VIVTDDQLSLAIGRKGQNVRLAAKLTGYAIDITSETEYRTKLEEKKKKQQEDRVLVASLPCVGERLAVELIQKGLDSPEAIANADQRELLAIPGIGAAKATKIQNAAREMIKAQTPVE